MDEESNNLILSKCSLDFHQISQRSIWTILPQNIVIVGGLNDLNVRSDILVFEFTEILDLSLEILLVVFVFRVYIRWALLLVLWMTFMVNI